MGERRDRKRRFEALRSSPLLAGCADEQLAEVDRLGAQVDLRRGTRLIREGGRSEECFVVVGGAAVAASRDRAVGRIDAGSVAGEMGLLHHTARSATVLATTPMRLLVLDRREFGDLLRVIPSIESALEELAALRRAELDLLGAA